jgi:prevent-host-death family protein
MTMVRSGYRAGRPALHAMAATISASQFKARCLGLMDQVAATGEVLVITKNGQPVAELHPCASARRPSTLRASSNRGDPWRPARPDRFPLGRAGVILLDTHVLLWLDREDPTPGHLCRERIQSAWTSGWVAVCAISLWEVAMQAARGRIALRQTPES